MTKELSSREEEKIKKTIKKRFGEVFLVSPYASRDDRKQALLQVICPERSYTIEELRAGFTETYKVPISRVSINTYINELEAEGWVEFQRVGLGGQKIISLKNQTNKPISA